MTSFCHQLVMARLIRKDQDRQRLRGLLLEGAASPPAVTAGPDYLSQLRDRVRGAGQR